MFPRGYPALRHTRAPALARPRERGRAHPAAPGSLPARAPRRRRILFLAAAALASLPLPGRSQELAADRFIGKPGAVTLQSVRLDAQGQIAVRHALPFAGHIDPVTLAEIEGKTLIEANQWITETTYGAARHFTAGAARYMIGTRMYCLVTPGAQPVPKPVLTRSGATTASTGRSFRYAITASDPGPIRYAAANLPPGLVLPSGSRVISGVPGISGRYLVTLSATNKGGTATATLDIIVRDRAAPEPLSLRSAER